MKKQLYVLSLLLLVFSCKENSNEEKQTLEKTTISSALDNEENQVLNNSKQDSKSQKAIYKTLKKKTPLTIEQLLPIIPEHINGNKKIGEHRFEASNQMANGTYGSYDSPYNFWIEDGSGSRAIVRNFYDSFKFKNKGQEGTEYVYQDRDGYQTIAFIQPKIKRNQISFIYNNRFKISLLGSDNADTLWSYIDFENLKKLDQY
tara:strand:+ start:33 stop:641 length:609 start_codon:yes stop_codon:yes gene_type:complete